MRTHTILFCSAALALTTACGETPTSSSFVDETAASPPTEGGETPGATPSAIGVDGRASDPGPGSEDPRKQRPDAPPTVVDASIDDCPVAPLDGFGAISSFAASTGGRVVAGITGAGDVVLVSRGPSGSANKRVVSELHGAVAIATGDEHFCALMPNGTVTCAGAGRRWLGDSVGNSSFVVESIDLSSRTTSPIVQIAAGGAASCALTTDRRVICWGLDNFVAGPGLVRHAPDDDERERVTLYELTNPFGSPVKQLATSGEHVCAALDDGRVTCFGNDSLGQLGNQNPAFLVGPAGTLETNPAHKSSKPLSLVPITDPANVVAVGYLDGCALEASGIIECWGDNRNGQLGDMGVQPQALTPRALTLSALGLAGSVEEIVLDERYACVRSTEGELACWGRVGTGAMTAPARVDLKGHSARSLRIVDERACALLEDQRVCCY